MRILQPFQLDLGTKEIPMKLTLLAQNVLLRSTPALPAQHNSSNLAPDLPGARSPQGCLNPEGRQSPTLPWHGLLLTPPMQGKLCYFYAALMSPLCGVSKINQVENTIKQSQTATTWWSSSQSNDKINASTKDSFMPPLEYFLKT